jgi:hypothetical protein
MLFPPIISPSSNLFACEQYVADNGEKSSVGKPFAFDLGGESKEKNMRIIPTWLHGPLDYLMGLLLIAAPWIFRLNAGGAETYVLIIIGCAMILLAAITDYEAGIVRGLTMSQHLWVDAATGIFLAASPWIFHFSDFTYLPHVVLGLGELIAAMMTDTKIHRHAPFPARPRRV